MPAHARSRRSTAATAASASRFPTRPCARAGCSSPAAPGPPSVASMLGVALPIRARVNTVSVTEPGPRRLTAGVGHATGLLTLKQKASGAYLIGGGWQGRGSPADGRGEIAPDNLLMNWRLARYAVPALAHARVLRSWTGFEAYVDDYWPLAGALPGVPGAYVLACVRGGYTIGPCIGPLVADRDPRPRAGVAAVRSGARHARRAGGCRRLSAQRLGRRRLTPPSARSRGAPRCAPPCRPPRARRACRTARGRTRSPAPRCRSPRRCVRCGRGPARRSSCRPARPRRG